MSTTTQHTGERYAPIVANPIEWNINCEYEYLTIVIHNGDSYISKQDVPKSVQITNTKYWLKTNNYRAQIDQAIEKSNEAISKATTATNLATSGLAKADEAKGKAEEASGKVNEAIGKADDAIGLATSGLAKADEAKGRSEEASGKANEAIAKADNALAKFPVSIADGGTGATTDVGALMNLGAIATKATTGPAYGPLLSVTAKGHAEQDNTTGKNLIPPLYYRTNNTAFAADESVPHEHRMRTSSFAVSANTVYTVSGMPSGTRLIGARCFDSAQQTLGDASVSGLNITTLANTAYMFILFGDDNITYTVDTKQVFIDSVQLELGSTATEYEPYTGGKPSPNPNYPQEIRVVRGRNLVGVWKDTGNVVHIVDAEGYVTNSTGNDGRLWSYANSNFVFTLPAGTYTLSCEVKRASTNAACGWSIKNESGTNVVSRQSLTTCGFDTVGVHSVTFTISAQGSYGLQAKVFDALVRFQLELGSTVHPYVPYGNVGLDVTADGKTTTTPIPLPSRGWVGSLPNGTHDALAIDGAGKVTWELADAMVMLNGSEGWSLYNNGTSVGTSVVDSLTKPNTSNTTKSNLLSSHFAALTPNRVWAGDVGANIGIQNSTQMLRFADGTGAMTIESWKAWLASNPTTVLYPLATPTTEDIGYVDLPDVPEGAVVSMPELEGLGVESWTSDAIADYTNAVAERADTNTTYSLSQDSSDGHKLTFAGSDGTSKIVTIPDNDTKALGSMTGTLSISHGGTGKTTAADAWTALGGGSIGKKSSLAASDIPSLDASKIGSGTLGIARGGTGATTATDARAALGVYQPERPEKTNLLEIDLNDRHSPKNRPHVVITGDVTKLVNYPSAITGGAFYGLWDCGVLGAYGNNHAQILVTIREMAPIPGRVWTNWFNWSGWTGWKSVTPSDYSAGRWAPSSPAGLVVFKRADIVTVNFASSGMVNYYNGAVIATLPTGYRPSETISAVAYAGSEPSNVAIESNGQIHGWGGSNTAEFWRFCVSFPAAWY